MPIIGPNQAITGTSAVGVDRSIRASERRPGRAVKSKDEIINETDSVELDDAVRSLKSNDQEEAREDHQQGGSYTPRGKMKDDKRPQIDLAG